MGEHNRPNLMKRYWVNFGIAVDGKPIGTGNRAVMRETTIQDESHLMEIANILAEGFRAEMRIPPANAVSINIHSWQRFEEPELEIVGSMAGLRGPH